jgi:bacterioferritin
MRENNIHKGYASPLPYPEIKVMEPNKYYATLLLEDYAGMISELTAVNQYSYHSFMLNRD